MARLLIVDDEPGLRRILSVLLGADGHAVVEASTLADAKRILGEETLDVILTDEALPDGKGQTLIAAAREADTSLPVIMLTAFATVDLAVRVMRDGAFDFLTKPFEPDNVRAIVRRAAERASLQRENVRLREQVRQLGAGDVELLGSSEPMKAVQAHLARVAPTNATVLITGETGTGKELAARAIHRLSPRHDLPFVPINCASLPETLLESELFGHERGAFTGADRARPGLFESADGGSLFLDEAGEMSLALQAKLLRVLADGQVQRVGSRVSKRVDVRLILATHRNLSQRVKDGQFREDLYYRVAVVPIDMPPLRKRTGDLPLLVEHFLDRIAKDLKVQRRPMSDTALVKLSAYGFPGNIRELRNLLERASILAQGAQIEPQDFPIGNDMLPSSAPAISALTEAIDLRAHLELVERSLIERALQRAQGVQAEAARKLGVSRSDLNYKLKKLGIDAGVHMPQES